MKFMNFYELSGKVIEYEELLREESHRRKTPIGTYYQEVKYEEITIVYILNLGFVTCLLLVKKTHST